MSQPLINFINVNFSFTKPPKTILQNFNFSLLPKDKVVIFGPSGSGKSTLLHLILGFHQPQSGTILFRHQPLTPNHTHQLRRQTAYLDQDVVLGRGPVQQVFQDYFHFQANRHLQPTTTSFKKTLHSLGLEEKILSKEVSQLSGGERQRLALALALLLNKPILLLDEITSALDPQSKQLVVNHLTQLTDKTILLVTHDQIWKQQPGFKLFDFKEKRWQ